MHLRAEIFLTLCATIKLSLHRPYMVRPPILSLPDELVLEVMKDVDRPLKLSAICSSWRRSALRYPPLWTTIRVHDLDVFSAVPHAQTFAARAMSLPLHIRRKGIDKDEDHALEVPLSVLDYLLFTLFQRCATFQYSRFTADGRFRRFMLAILSSPAPMLRSFHLSHGEEEILLPPSVPILDVGTNWPMLREFVLDSVCMPLHRLRLTNLETLKIWVPICDTEPCQLHPGLGRCIANFVRASPTLRELHINYDDGNENAHHSSDPLDPVHIDGVCQASLQHLYLSGLWLAWLVPLRMLDSPPRLTNLSSLFISGTVTSPVDPNRDEQPAVPSFIRVLAGTPNLQKLFIEEWTDAVDMTVDDPAALAKVQLTMLTTVNIEQCAPEWCQHILASLIAPTLRTIVLDVVYADGDDAGQCGLFIPTPWSRWSFPGVESLKVAVGGCIVGYIPKPASALELGPLLRDGDWTSLKELTLEGHGWLSEDALDVIIDALSDRNIAPCLQRLHVTRCSIFGGVQYHPAPSDPSRTPRRDVDAAAYLAEMRSDRSDSSSEPGDTTRLSVQFSECDACDDCDSSGSESNSDDDLSSGSSSDM
ncbi:hypothetical protein EXIGLDRAFT_773569 [Exidia glandulosa HHB12029]|uniref:Uncharacterized protein n=1 Tax=Exidia glandulosa HHB12029 TaxID=1314781 RepID=A0A165EQY5_EXIGL|nr:hypothetical protein EXIGLDRAFT_773569 [Exidia glandulosa HHB12029]